MINKNSSPINFFIKNSKQFGDVFRFRAGSRRGYFVNHPDLIKEVLVTNQSAFIKEDSFKRIKNVTGNGILVSDGDFYLRQRRAVQPAFHRQKIEALGETMLQIAEEHISNWKDGQTIDIFHDMSALSLKIVAKTLFETDFQDEIDEIGEAVKTVLYSAPFVINPEENYTIVNSSLLDEVKIKLDKIIYGLIEQRKSDGIDRGDLFSMMIFGNQQSEPMTDEELRDEAVTILTAGHETLATALTWSWYLIAQNSLVQEKLQTEIRDACGNSRKLQSINAQNLSYTRKVFTEAMRIFPPIWAVIRLSIKDTLIGTVKIPKDSVILISQYITHHDARFFDQPEEFLPDRWTKEMQKELPQFAYFPFGGGMRRCIGEHFAWLEGILLIAAIARKWQLELIQNQEVEFSELITLRPKNEIKMKLKSIFNSLI